MSYPKTPKIRRHGTIKCGTVESTPVVFRGRLYRFEYCRPSSCSFLNSKNPENPDPISKFFFIDLETGCRTKPFALNHHLGSAFADGNTMYAFGVAEEWGTDTVRFFRSEDLENWECCSTLTLPEWKIYNTGVCKMGDTYTLLMEISAPLAESGPHPFTFRFATSPDMIHWTLTPSECVFNKDRYAGGPALYSIGDGYYYVLYLEAYPGRRYANSIARSRDLIHWEYSPLNPVMMYNEEEDKQIANPFLSEEHQKMIADALDINNSDMELCQFHGRTIIYYSWGNQMGNEFLAEASYEGPMDRFLRSWFEPEL